MTEQQRQRSRELLINLRKIIQAIDLQSKHLSKKFGLTGPQLVILQELADGCMLSISEISRSISLSQGTVTDIVSRLEKKGLVTRTRSNLDKRKVEVGITPAGHRVLQDAPSPLQEQFVRSFHRLEDWEQLMIISSISRVVSLISAEEIDAAPFLISGPIQNKDKK